MKNSQAITYIDEAGVEHTIDEYYEPRSSERTWPLNKSKHTVWAQGVSNYTRGIRGTLGTVNEA